MTGLRRCFLPLTLIVLAGCALAGCAASENPTNMSGAGGSGSGGNVGSGGTNDNAGAAGAGAGTAGAAGANATAGTSGAAGAVGAGGAIGSGGTTGAAGGGTAGSVGRGGAIGTAGRGGATGTAGTAGTGTGGARGGTTGAGGSAGSTGSGGSGVFTINVQLASAMKSTAPTTVGIVTWSISVSGVTAAHIDFGLDTSYGMTAPVDLTATNYRTVLIGMKPAKTYHFRVVATAGSNTYMSNDQTVTTGAKVSTNLITGFTVMNASAVPKGFFITSFWNGTGQAIPFIFDTDGDVVWWHTGESGESTDGISRARMSADSQNIWLVNESLSGNPLRRVTVDGLTTQIYGAPIKASHDIAAVSGDTMAYLDYSETDCNSIFEINNAGTTKEVFEPTNVTSTGTGMNNCHGNAVRYSKKEDFYTYSDWEHELAAVNRMGVLQWKLTQKVSGGIAAWGGMQHGHQLLDSSIILFANMSNGAPGSTPKSQAFEFALSDGHLIKQFMSRGGATNFGDVQRLSNGNTIITYSTTKLLTEVDANDTVVLQVMGAGSWGYVEFRDNLYGPPLDINQ